MPQPKDWIAVFMLIMVLVIMNGILVVSSKESTEERRFLKRTLGGLWELGRGKGEGGLVESLS